ncbi:hypothetical protein LCGC14_0217860 [marine sediment metagenome]|uniref:DUF2141 domain-containing protein n=1 Tax=marine sediment metagenome TaxID=412755 RepID=A0A0F9XHM6_9ZZZZ|nr:DUF2141 domain-containing protein [Maribacter sp.]HDZ04126.1 DUF2141 domain-containing protein [Maribacter sp.]HEA79827.1 DUF2141 domain-containing protein [Maribacter sp.]
MKKLLFTITVLAMTLTMNAQEKEGVTLTVIIENVLNNEGHVLSALHSEDTFMKADGIKTTYDKAEEGELILTIENVQPGDYAFSVLHDANDNQRMDFETNGMPLENYAMSNNPMLMGPPTFSDVKFSVATDDMEIKLRF